MPGQLDLGLLPQDADILPFPTVECGQFGWGCQNSQKSTQNASKLSLNLQIIPQLLMFTGPSLKPPHPNKPEWMAILLYLLIQLNKFKDFAVDVSQRRPWNDNVHEWGLVCTDHVQCMIMFASYNNVFEEHGSSLERQAVGKYGTFWPAMNRCQQKSRTDGLDDKLVHIRRHVVFVVSWTETIRHTCYIQNKHHVGWV